MTVAIAKDEALDYCREAPFHPAEKYPEYPFEDICPGNRVYGAVRQNGGHIEVYSEPGVGTTFKILIPRVAESPEQRTAAVQGPSRGGHETIALVEDDPSVRALALEALSEQGYSVHAFPNGAEAVRVVGELEGPLDLLVTDVIMPGMNGKVLAESLRRLRPQLKVLYTSGYTQNVIAHHGVLDPGVEFLAKPYSVEALAARVREVLDH